MDSNFVGKGIDLLKSISNAAKRQGEKIMFTRKWTVTLLVTILVLGVLVSRSTASEAPSSPALFRVPVIGSYKLEWMDQVAGCTGHIGQGRYLDINNLSGGNTDKGDPIYAAYNGTITFEGWGPGTYGNNVLLRANGDNGVTFRYAHLDKIYVANDDQVASGTLIGLMGDTGGDWNSHLHWEAWLTSQGPSNTEFNIFNITGVNENTNSPCNNAGTVNGESLPSNPHSSCVEYGSAFANDPHIALFDNQNCTGNPHRLNGAEGERVLYDLNGGANFNDRTRSIYVPSGWAVVVGANVNDDPYPLNRCFISSQDDLDEMVYSNTDPQGQNVWIGYNPTAQINPSSRDGYDMISYAAVSRNTECFEPLTAVSSYSIGQGGSGSSPSWLLEFSKTKISPSQVEIHTRVDAEPGVYDAHQVLVDGEVIFESSAGEQYHTWNTSGLSTGYHTLRVEYRRLSDGGNWSNALSYEEQYYIAKETIPPVTTVTLSGTEGNNDWFVSPVDVTLSASDNAGVANTYYQIDGGSVVEGTQFTLTNDGVYNVSFWSVDVNGNVESTKTIQVMIDQTPPETTGTVTGPRDINGIFRDNVTADITATDNLSGVDSTQCSWDNGATWQSLSQMSFLVEGNGVHQFFCKSQDIAGNVGEELDSGPIIINMYAIFNRNATNGFLMDSATNIEIDGDIYSEGPVTFEWNTGVYITDTIEIVNGTFSNDWSNTNVNVGNVVTNAPHVNGISYPFLYYRERCTSVYSNGLTLYDVGQEMNSVVCVNGNLSAYTVNVTGDVTFVVDGDIHFEPTCGEFYTNDPNNGMLMYATGDITLAGNCYDVLGLVYAPNGEISVQSTDAVYRGSLVADHVGYLYPTGVDLVYNAAFAADTFDLPVANVSFADPSEEDDDGQTSEPTPTPQPTATPVPSPTPENSQPCTDCEQYAGSLVGTDEYQFQPDGSYYYSSSGTHDGWLEGPADADFNLYLQKWNGSDWTIVDWSINSDSSEHVNYSGTSGYYVWVVHSNNGSGNYDFWMKRP